MNNIEIFLDGVVIGVYVLIAIVVTCIVVPFIAVIAKAGKGKGNE